MAKKHERASSRTAGKPGSNKNVGKEQSHKRGKLQKPCGQCGGIGVVQSERRGAKPGDSEFCKRCGGSGFQDI